MSVPEYLPGAWTAVSRPGFVALLGPSAAPATARAVWEASADGLLAGLVVLARNGFAGLPAFALVHLEGGRAHLALRGDVTAEVGTPSGPRTMRAGDVGTWSEQVVEDATWVRLRSDGASDEGTGLPLGDGVAPASTLGVVLVEGVEQDEAQAPAVAVADDEPVATPGVIDAADAPAWPTTAAAEDAPVEAVVGPADAPADEPVVEADEHGTDAFATDAPTTDEPVLIDPALTEPELTESAATEAPADEAAADEAVADGAASDEAVATAVEPDEADEPAAAPVAQDVPPTAPEVVVAPAPVVDAPEPVAAFASSPVLPRPGAALVGPPLDEPVEVPAQRAQPVTPDVFAPDAPPAPQASAAETVPETAGETAAEAPVEPVGDAEAAPALVALGTPEPDVESTDPRALVGPASQDDHDGLTILSSDLAQIREQLPAWAAQWPADGATPGPFTVPEPATPQVPARLVLSTGVEVTLDRTVLLGRAPQVARVTNRELPRLVAVPSPQQDISRTHAEVRAEGEHVLVTDLHSTNGVHVTRQGEGARRLHPGEPSVVVPGEVVDLGDGVTFTVEAGR